MTDTLSLVLAAVAVVLQVVLGWLLLLAIAALFSDSARSALRAVRDTLLGGELWAAWAVAAVATLASLYYSEIADFVPCRLCWFQRIAMYPMAVILLIAAVRRDRRGGALYALPLPVLGAMVSIYHVYIELNPEAESASCKIGAPCSVKWVEELGYVTLPVLALTAFATIFALLAMAVSHRAQQQPPPPPPPPPTD